MLLESFTAYQDQDIWNDQVAVFLKDRAELGGAEGGHQLVQFNQMLSVYQRFHDVLARHVLPLHHALDAPLLLQDVHNPVQQRRQVGRWVQPGVHVVVKAGRCRGG